MRPCNNAPRLENITITIEQLGTPLTVGSWFYYLWSMRRVLEAV